MLSLCSNTPDPPERSISPAMIDTFLKKTAGWQVPSYSRRAALVGKINTFLADHKGWRSCVHANSLLLSNLSYALSMLTYGVKHDLNSGLDGDAVSMAASRQLPAAADHQRSALLSRDGVMCVTGSGHLAALRSGLGSLYDFAIMNMAYLAGERRVSRVLFLKDAVTRNRHRRTL